MCHGHLFNLKPGGDKTQAMGIAEAKNNYWQTNRRRKQLIEIQDGATEISAQI